MTEITKKTTLGEIVEKFPEAVPVMMSYGLHCVGCHVAFNETVEEGARAHGFNDEEIEKLVKDLNEAIKKKKE